MKTYYALVHKDADSAFGITFPDLPGCFSAADDEDEIFAGAQSALALYASDETSLPRARSFSELRADAEVRAEIATGAFLIAVPFIAIQKKSRYNLMLPSELVEGVDQTAQALGVSRSEFVSEAIGARLEAQAGAVVVKREAQSGRFFKSSKLVRHVAKSAAASALTQKTKKK